MQKDAAHESNWKTAEVVFGIPFLFGIVLHFAIPFLLPRPISLAFMVFGAVFIALGIGLIILGRREFARYRQPTDPGHSTQILIKTGVFALSRNPLYVGGALLILGISLFLKMPWALGMLLISMVTCYHLLIKPEELYLQTKFGKEFQEYSDSVCRWLGHK